MLADRCEEMRAKRAAVGGLGAPPQEIFGFLAFCRAGATGTTGTAMAVPVLEEEKWRCWDSDLRTRSYILLEASAVQSRDHTRTDCSMGRFESRQFSWSRDETSTHGMTGLTRRARVTATFKHFPFHVESETVTESSGSAVQKHKGATESSSW